MEKHKRNPVAYWRSLFPEAVIRTDNAEKELTYHNAHFGIRALEYVVFIGTLLTLGLFTAAIFQVIHKPSAAFYLSMAALFIGANILLHLFVQQRLLDALATGIGAFGVASFNAALFSLEWRDKDIAIAAMLLLLGLILISRKNLLTILGTVGIFYLLYWLFDSLDIASYRFKLVIMAFTLMLGMLIYLEEQIMGHLTKWTYFFNYLKHGFFIALTTYFVLGFRDWTSSRGLEEPLWYNMVMYTEFLLLAVLLFVWQYRRLKQERMPLWLVVLFPFSLFLLGIFSVKIAFFLLAFLAFLFTRSIFGIVTSALGLIYTVIHFYYDLEWTLMQKSLVFIGLGVLYLGLYVVLISKKTSS